MMTALACIVGMMPLAFGTSIGSEWKKGIGWVIMGGMTSSMLLSFIVVPVVYSLLESLKIWLKRKLGIMQTHLATFSREAGVGKQNGEKNKHH
jgi:HAE1 family hydrophobic/amphiphilic exporter-1